MTTTAKPEGGRMVRSDASGQDALAQVARRHGRFIVTSVACAVALSLGGCVKGAQTSDPTPPTMVLLSFQRNAQGGQASQVSTNPGGQITVSRDFLGIQKADIRVNADDPEGVGQLAVSGSARGTCSTKVDSHGQFFTSPGPLSASFPMQTETSSPGTVSNFMARFVDDLVLDASCGTHRFANMAQPAEFFMDSGSWTITATAKNCCGGGTTSTFMIVVQ